MHKNTAALARHPEIHLEGEPAYNFSKNSQAEQEI